MTDSAIDMSQVRDRREPARAVVASPDITPAQMLAIAVQQGADLQKLEKLMDLRDRWEAGEARKAYVAAMAAFKANPPTIVKNKHVAFNTSKGRTEYNHATHDEVTNKIIVALSPHGLSHNWSVRQADGMVYVKCTITHERGHSESVEMFGPPDDTGLKSPIQQIASTVTLLQRYTLIAVTGLSTEEIGKAETDGRALKDVPAPPEGYDAWQADMAAVAEEGTARLTEAWGGSKAEYRRHVVKYDEVWWIETKAKAAKVAS